MPEATANSIEASFGLNLAPLKSNFAEAKRIASTESAGIANTIKNNLATADKAMATSARAPVSRGGGLSRQALNDRLAYGGWNNPPPRGPRTAADFKPAPKGKYKSPAEQEAESAAGTNRSLLTSYRFAAGAVALTGIKSLIDKGVEIAESAIAASTRIHRLTLDPGNSRFLTRQKLESNLGEQSDALEERREREAHERSGLYGRVSKGVRQTISGIPDLINEPGAALKHLMRNGIGKTQRDVDAGETKEKESLRKAAIQSIEKLAEKESALNSVREQGFSGSEKQAALDAQRIAHEERLGKIIEEQKALGSAGSKAPINAENQRDRQEQAAIERRFTLRQAESEMEIRLGLLRKTGIGDEAAALASLRERIALKEQELQQPQTNESRDEISAERLGMEAQLNTILRERARTLEKMRAVNRIAARRDAGNHFGADLDDITSNARRDIRSARRNGFSGMAAQTGSNARQNVVSSLANELQKSPEQREAEREAAAERQQALRTAAAQIKDARDRRSRGAYNQTGDAAAAGQAIDQINAAEKGGGGAAQESTLGEIKELMKAGFGKVGLL